MSFHTALLHEEEEGLTPAAHVYLYVTKSAAAVS